ncbi:hypothetical protein [Mycobacterium shigaense]|uniref:Uncharacterized protein n=1 Tax=Mycobacterium shigaense TaxID=722731 RepID=A0A1Z4EJB6_9MYCO|nr:hypothetical protein [Mycobacterium shigaense]MEA1123998.1 hypothetical protein [Mycobacterium shigaense]PRI13837.1 hypothetical protein B2J96_19575 [Mycobacterium shigaense]BAX92990.1 hypothetical protein MSG_02846 [Mycobacterium shigaense]
MTEAPEKTEPRWAELSDDVLESVETARKQAIEAARKFVDQISPVLPEQSRRKTVVDAALDLAEELVTARIQFFRSVVHSTSEVATK